jgi:hypothetical protein
VAQGESTITKQEFDSEAHMDLTIYIYIYITVCFVMVVSFAGLPG